MSLGAEEGVPDAFGVEGAGSSSSTASALARSSTGSWWRKAYRHRRFVYGVVALWTILTFVLLIGLIYEASVSKESTGDLSQHAKDVRLGELEAQVRRMSQQMQALQANLTKAREVHNGNDDMRTRKMPRNVVFMLSDGMGFASPTMARIVQAKMGDGQFAVASLQPGNAAPVIGRLALDDHVVGSISTYSSSSWVTDSAAGATAYSCGLKSYNGAIAVDPVNKKPCGTLMEAAKTKGFRTGIVVTSRVTHATPAAFTAHVEGRDMEALIAEQQAKHAQLDVMFGGGRSLFSGPSRPDGQDLIAFMKTHRNATVVTEPTGMQDLSSADDLPAVGLFANSHMDFNIDRDPNSQPALHDMAIKALDLLQQGVERDRAERTATEDGEDSPGFFMLIEGSRIDMASHNNDPAAHVFDVIEYDKTFAAVLDWCQEHGDETLVVSVSDHETGGLSLGRRYRSVTHYPPYLWKPELLRNVTSSVEKMSSLIFATARVDSQNGNGDEQTLLMQQTVQQVKEHYQFELNEAERARVQDILTKNNPVFLGYVLGDILAERAFIGWSSIGHSGTDIPLFAYNDPGLDDSTRLRHNMANIDVGRYLQTLFGFDVDKETQARADWKTIQDA